ncbi:MAG TPA: aspartate ammonia-lyase [Peptococcaceae bacterium]|nr:aspartate ammonia-lyase [Peptococcaceae bacterium]
MNLVEAAKEAIITGRAIARTKGMFAGIVKIKPTNTENCLIRGSGMSEIPRRGWQPKAEDLVAEDWIIVDWE